MFLHLSFPVTPQHHKGVFVGTTPLPHHNSEAELGLKPHWCKQVKASLVRGLGGFNPTDSFYFSCIHLQLHLILKGLFFFRSTSAPGQDVVAPPSGENKHK